MRAVSLVTCSMFFCTVHFALTASNSAADERWQDITSQHLERLIRNADRGLERGERDAVLLDACSQATRLGKWKLAEDTLGKIEDRDFRESAAAELCREQIRKGDLAGADRTLRLGIANEKLIVEIVAAHAARGDSETATYIAQNRLSNTEHRALALLKAASSAWSAGHCCESQFFLQMAETHVRASPKSADLLAFLAETYGNLSEFDRYQKTTDELVRTFSEEESSRQINWLARDLASAGCHDLAILAVRRLKDDPGDVDRGAVEGIPHSAGRGFYELAVIFKDRGDAHKLAELTTISRPDRTGWHDDIRLLLVQLLVQRSQWDAATLWTRCISDVRTRLEAQTEVGLSLVKSSRLAEAKRLLKESSDLLSSKTPDRIPPEIYARLAHLSAASGDRTKAKDYLSSGQEMLQRGASEAIGLPAYSAFDELYTAEVLVNGQDAANAFAEQAFENITRSRKGTLWPTDEANVRSVIEGFLNHQDEKRAVDYAVRWGSSASLEFVARKLATRNGTVSPIDWIEKLERPNQRAIALSGFIWGILAHHGIPTEKPGIQ